MSNVIRPKVSNEIKRIAGLDAEGKSANRIDTQKEYNKLQEYLSGNYEELNETEKNSIRSLLDKAKELLKPHEKETAQEKVEPKPSNDSTENTKGKYLNEIENNTGNESQTAQENVTPKPNNDSIQNKNNDHGGEQIEQEQVKPKPDNDSVQNKNNDHSGEQIEQEQVEPKPDNDSVENKNNNHGGGIAELENDKPEPDGVTDKTNSDMSYNENEDFETKAETTGIDNHEAASENKMPGKKFMRNGEMCIKMPNGHIYNMQGRRIK